MSHYLQQLGTALLCLLLLAGCRAQEPAVVSPQPEPTLPTSAPAEPQIPDPVPEPESDSDTQPETPEETTVSITISAVGDVTLGTNQKTSYEGSFHDYYDRYGPEYFLQNVRSIFEADDFTVVNLEGTLTNSTNAMEKRWNHKGKPEYIDILSCSSVEAVTLGNNHIMDYMQEGADDTMAAVEGVGIEYALSGEWGNRYGMFETKGIKIGFVSVNENYDGDAVYPWLEDGLRTLREQGADIVIACPHWGDGKTHSETQPQYEMGKWCIDQGYDLVVGCHPHVLQGIERYKGRYIVYSMGNFCYGGNKNPEEKDSMIFQQTFTFTNGELVCNPEDIRVLPCRLSSVTHKNDYCPVLLTGKEAEQTISNLNCYSEEFGTVFDADGYLVEFHDIGTESDISAP